MPWQLSVSDLETKAPGAWLILFQSYIYIHRWGPISSNTAISTHLFDHKHVERLVVANFELHFRALETKSWCDEDHGPRLVHWTISKPACGNTVFIMQDSWAGVLGYLSADKLYVADRSFGSQIPFALRHAQWMEARRQLIRWSIFLKLLAMGKAIPSLKALRTDPHVRRSRHSEWWIKGSHGHVLQSLAATKQGYHCRMSMLSVENDEVRNN